MLLRGISLQGSSDHDGVWEALTVLAMGSGLTHEKRKNRLEMTLLMQSRR